MVRGTRKDTVEDDDVIGSLEKVECEPCGVRATTLSTCSTALPFNSQTAYPGLMTSPMQHRYLGVQGRGTVALPADVRRRLHLDEPGAQLEMTERADGVIELRAALPVPADQRWFWAERWQEREREVDEHVASGRVEVHESADAFLGHLDELDTE